MQDAEGGGRRLPGVGAMVNAVVLVAVLGLVAAAAVLLVVRLSRLG
jgi:hypothetical protein